MLDLLLEAMPCPHVAKQDITDLGRLVLVEPVHAAPPLPWKGAEGASGGLRPRFRPQPFKLLWLQPAIPHRVLHALVPHEGRAGLQISPADKIKPAGVA